MIFSCFILALKFLGVKLLILLAKADALAEKIPRLEYHPSGGIILAQGLDF